MKKKVFRGISVILVICGTFWFFYDVTTPTFLCREVNRTPIQVFGPYGTIKGAAPEILEREFWFRVDISNLSLDWREYKRLHGQEEYVHAYGSGGVTILTDNPYYAWKFFDGYNRKWARVYLPSARR